jgi:hypothetical protein
MMLRIATGMGEIGPGAAEHPFEPLEAPPPPWFDAADPPAAIVLGAALEAAAVETLMELWVLVGVPPLVLPLPVPPPPVFALLETALLLEAPLDPDPLEMLAPPSALDALASTGALPGVPPSASRIVTAAQWW